MRSVEFIMLVSVTSEKLNISASDPQNKEEE